MCLSNAKSGDMTVFETFDGIISYDVVEFVEVDSENSSLIKIIRYWYNQFGQWICWSREDYMTIHVEQVKMIGFKLVNQKLPKALVKQLLQTTK